MSDTLTSAELDAQARQARRIADDLAQQALAARRAEQEARKPKMPEISTDENAAVVAFTKYQSGREYAFAAIGWRQGQHVRWSVTGQETRRFNWAGLLAFIGEANWHTLRVLQTKRLIGPQSPAEEPAVAERMGRYGKVLSTDAVDEVGIYGFGTQGEF